MKRTACLASILVAAAAVAQKPPFELEADRKPKLQTGGNCLIHAGRILTASHGAIENSDILVRGGKIAQIGRGLKLPAGFVEIDARKMVVAPGIIDGHSHRATDGTNEGSDSITAEVRIGDTLNMQALSSWQALASGHTSAMILHGSANAIGGQSQVIKYKYNRPATEAMIADAPRMIKFALGENVTRKSSTNSNRFPKTRMGQEAVYRRAFTEAKQYMADWDAFKAGKAKNPPRKDLRLETLADILRRKVWVQCHSYRSDEILMMVRLSQEFGFKIGAMQHALEAYKIAPELAAAGVGVSIFEDEWSFKQEGYDAIPWNAWICTRHGVNVSINTDGMTGTTALNIDAAKTMRFGGLSEEEALRTVTLNPARELGIDHRTGSIDLGKDADLVMWDGHPLSVYAKCQMTMIEGEVYFQRRDAFGVDSIGMKKLTLDRKSNRDEARPLPQAECYAIVGATIHPVSSGVIDGGTVVIEGKKIKAVGKNVAIPSNARVIEGRGLHVYPGFIDGWSTIGLAEVSPIPVMMDNSELGQFQPDLDAQTAIWCESAHFGPAKYNGVTNAFTAPSGGLISGQGAVINTDGYTTEQFGLQRKAALWVNFTAGGGGGFDGDACEDEVTGAVDRQDDKKDLGGRQFDFGGGGGQGASDGSIAGYFDKAIAYMKKRQADPTSPIDPSLEAMIPYVKGERLVVFTARSASNIRGAVAFIKKYKLKAALANASEAWREAKLLKASGIPVILEPAGKTTLGANSTDRTWDPYDTPYVSPGLLAKAGVKFCFGSNKPEDVMNLAVRVGEDCAYGLSQEDAIRAITLAPAEIFGVADRIGSVDAGKLANIIVTDGDPFEMTSTYRYVFIEGKPRALVSKHTMLRDKYAPRK